MKSEVRGGIFEKFDMANHLPSRLYLGIRSTTVFVKISTEMGRPSMADPETGLGDGPNLKQFRKRNRISLAYGLTSNKSSTSVNKCCFVFLLLSRNMSILCHFGRLGGHGCVWRPCIRF